MAEDGRRRQIVRQRTFKGWVILVDARTMEPICQSVFEASNSAQVTKTRPKIAGIKIGSRIATAVAEDFTDNFWSAANAAIGRMRASDGSAR